MDKYIIGRKIKKLVTVLLIAAFISGLVPGSIFNQAPTASAAVPSVQAKAYVVMDANSGGVIYKKSMNKRIYPASTVKLMTAIVALENADLDKKITFTKKLRKMIPSDASKLGLKAGTTYSVRQYLNMMLIASDADSATALASGTAGTYENFITLMNDTAKKYGMDRTSFDNPSGLDTGNGFNKTYTTAYDFAILARHAMSYEIIRNIVSKSTYNVPARKGKPSFKIKNTNGFYSTYKLKGKKYSIIGSKTGTTRAAGRVLIATARDESGNELICAYFGGNTSDNLYNGIEKLLDYAYKQYSNGKTSLVAGFWDTRFRDSGDVISKHVTSGTIPMTANGKFNPENIKNQAYTINLINNISGLGMVPGSGTELTVADLAMSYYNYINTQTEGNMEDMQAEDKGDTEAGKLTEEEMAIASNIDNADSFNIQEQKQIAYLYLSGAMAGVNIKDARHQLTKEEAVVIADLLAA